MRVYDYVFGFESFGLRDKSVYYPKKRPPITNEKIVLQCIIFFRFTSRQTTMQITSSFRSMFTHFGVVVYFYHSQENLDEDVLSQRSTIFINFLGTDEFSIALHILYSYLNDACLLVGIH